MIIIKYILNLKNNIKYGSKIKIQGKKMNFLVIFLFNNSF